MLLIFIDFLKKTPPEINFKKIFYVYNQHPLKNALKNI